MLAIQAAAEAGKKIMEFYTDEIDVTIKTDGSPVTLADIASSEVILNYLSQSNIPVTGEETTKENYDIRKQWSRSWCVDPLDGTKEFIKRNDQFAINIALIENHKPIFGLIASPVDEFMVFGGMDVGVFKTSFEHWNEVNQWERIDAAEKLNNPLIISCSNSAHSGTVLKYINELKKDLPTVDFLKKGSALKFIDLALGNADIYPRFAPTMEWDIAAGQAIIEALGGSVVHAYSNEPLEYNKENLLNPYFIAKTATFLKSE